MPFAAFLGKSINSLLSASIYNNLKYLFVSGCKFRFVNRNSTNDLKNAKITANTGKNAKKPLGHITKILIKNQTHNKHFQDKKINDKKED